MTLGVNVIGVIEPESRQAASVSANRRIGLLATTATVASGAYARALAAQAPDAELIAVACPDLAPIIQQGFPFDHRVVETVRGYCAPLREAGVDTVILGCTHYPLIAPMFQRMLGPGVTLVTSGRALALSVARSLKESGLGASRRQEGTTLPVHRRRRELRHGRFALPADADRADRARRAADGGGGVTRSYDRAANEARPVSCVGDFVPPASGSALISVGRTQVICTASVEGGVPRWMSGKGRGWVTAEYGMLPASTGSRNSATRRGCIPTGARSRSSG